MLAVANGHLDAVLSLITSGAIVNNKDINGRTALHRGVRFRLPIHTIPFWYGLVREIPPKNKWKAFYFYF